jgi:hypothetical protein
MSGPRLFVIACLGLCCEPRNSTQGQAVVQTQVVPAAVGGADTLLPCLVRCSICTWLPNACSGKNSRPCCCCCCCCWCCCVLLTVLPGSAPCVVQYVFMDMGTYEETRLARDDWAKYLKEGAICYLVFYNGQVSTQTHDCWLADVTCGSCAAHRHGRILLLILHVLPVLTNLDTHSCSSSKASWQGSNNCVRSYSCCRPVVEGGLQSATQHLQHIAVAVCEGGGCSRCVGQLPGVAVSVCEGECCSRCIAAWGFVYAHASECPHSPWFCLPMACRGL